MNVITGLWGMNVHVPGQDIKNLNWFGGICTAMVIIAVTGYITTVRYLSNRYNMLLCLVYSNRLTTPPLNPCCETTLSACELDQQEHQTAKPQGQERVLS